MRHNRIDFNQNWYMTYQVSYVKKMVKTYEGKEYESNAEYLQSRHWRTTSGRFMRKNREKGCYVCKRKDSLHVRHKRWKRSRDGRTVYGRERYRDLQLVCSECHDAIHHYKLDGLMEKRKIRSKEQLDFWIQQRLRGNTSDKPKEYYPSRLHTKRS